MNKQHTPIDNMLEEIRRAVGNCSADEKEVFEALVDEAEGWKMRLQELEQEESNG